MEFMIYILGIVLTISFVKPVGVGQFIACLLWPITLPIAFVAIIVIDFVIWAKGA